MRGWEIAQPRLTLSRLAVEIMTLCGRQQTCQQFGRYREGLNPHRSQLAGSYASRALARQAGGVAGSQLQDSLRALEVANAGPDSKHGPQNRSGRPFARGAQRPILQIKKSFHKHGRKV